MQENKNVEVKEELKNDLSNEDTLKAKYGRVIKINVELEEMGEDLTFYFKAPSTASFSRYIKNASKKQLQAGIDFSQENVIEEQKEKFKNVVENYVGVSQMVTAKILEMFGFTDNITAKKL